MDSRITGPRFHNQVVSPVTHSDARFHGRTPSPIQQGYEMDDRMYGAQHEQEPYLGPQQDAYYGQQMPLEIPMGPGPGPGPYLGPGDRLQMQPTVCRTVYYLMAMC